MTRTTDVPLSAFAPAAADLDLDGNKLTNVQEPLEATDAATKGYVDQAFQGFNLKQSVRAASTANLTLEDLQTIDGVELEAGDRVLVKDQTADEENGIYEAGEGVWLRAADADDEVEVAANFFVFVEEGSTQADTGWVLTTNPPLVVGTTPLTFAQFSGPGSIALGDGLTWMGDQLEIAVGDGLLIDTEEIAIDTTVVARKYSANITGDGTEDTFEVTHNLDTRDVVVQVRETSSPYTAVGEAEVTIQMTSVDSVTVLFTAAPANLEVFRVTVHG